MHLAACILVGLSLFPITSATLVVTSTWACAGTLYAFSCTGLTWRFVRAMAGILTLPYVCPARTPRTCNRGLRLDTGSTPPQSLHATRLKEETSTLSWQQVCSHFRSEVETALSSKLGVSQSVFSFAIFLGVSTFGTYGLLFGPVLVCTAKKLLEVLTMPHDDEGSNHEHDDDDDGLARVLGGGGTKKLEVRYSRTPTK